MWHRNPDENPDGDLRGEPVTGDPGPYCVDCPAYAECYDDDELPRCDRCRDRRREALEEDGA